MSSIVEIAKKAKAASVILARLSGEQKNKTLLAVASSISRHREEILAANRMDLLAARPLVESGWPPCSMTDSSWTMPSSTTW
jgi:gamma-glutamyl phosphate reductase